MDDAPARQTPQAAGARRPRFGIAALAALYALSLAAAAVLAWRTGGGSGRRDLLPSPKRLLGSSDANVGWLSIHGPIYYSATGKVWERGIEQWGRRLDALAEKKEIKAIVLDINSPGGSVGAVQELHKVILRVRRERKKPVVALLGDMAASGGYYLAVACDKVVAHPGTLVGSIGVIFSHVEAQGLLGKLGVRAEPIKSGRLKDIGSPARPMTAEERALLQGVIDDAYGQFLSAVAQGRGATEEKLRPLADGRIFTGRQALGLGLVDQLGDSQDAVELAAKLGGISGKPKVSRESDSLESVLSLMDSTLSGLAPLQSAALRELRSLVPMGLEYRWTGSF